MTMPAGERPDLGDHRGQRPLRWPGNRATAPSCGALTGTGAGNAWARYRNAHRRVAVARPDSKPTSCARVPADQGCLYDEVDAISAAASYLHDLGAGPSLDDRAWRAAQRYNGAAAYADAVDGLRDTQWRVTLARTERHGDGWPLSRWEPQP